VRHARRLVSVSINTICDAALEIARPATGMRHSLDNAARTLFGPS
jgi:hypothetical protein